MSKIFKKSIIFFIVLVIFLGVFAIPVKATVDTGFRINSGDYYITLNEDGSARIIENWYLEYFKDGDTFNFRHVLKNTKEIAESTTLKDLNVYIDEVICEETQNDEYQKDYTYNLSENNKSYNITTFLKSKENDIRHITITYTLKDLVKSIDGKYYFVNLDLFPVMRDRTIKDVSATIRLHNDEKIELIENPYLYPIFAVASVEGNELKTHLSDLKETTYKISFKISNDCFNIPTEKIISEEDLPKNENPFITFLVIIISYFILCIITIKFAKKTLKVHLTKKRILFSILTIFIGSICPPNGIMGIFIAIWLFIIICCGFKQEDIIIQLSENIKDLEKDESISTTIIYKYKNIIDYRKLLDYTMPFAHLSFFIRLADAHQKHILAFEDNGDIKFNLKTIDKKDPLFKILSHIKKYCDKKKIQYKIDNKETITFSLEIIKEYFKDIKNYRYVFQIFHPTMYNVIDDFRAKVKDKQERKEFQDDCLKLISMVEVLNEKNISFEELIKIPISPESYLNFIRNDLEKEPNGDNYSLVDFALYDIYKKHVEICKKKKYNKDTGMPEN